MSLTMKQWTTNGIQPIKQFDFWRETICQSFVPLRPERTAGRSNASFRGELATWKAADIFFANVSGDGQFVFRDPEAITNNDQAVYFLNFQRRGNAVIEQTGNTAALNPGSFALIDAMQPFRMQVSDNFDQLSIKIPHALLKQHIAQPSLALALALGSENIRGRLAMKALNALADEGDLPTDRFSSVAVDHALQLIALALGHREGTVTQRRKTHKTLHALRTKAIELMQLELDNVDFSPINVALQLGVSVRYLQAAFTESNTSIRDWVLEQRLNRCRADLISPTRAFTTISNIAYSHGFNDLSYFNRAFKIRYGCTPGKYNLYCVN
jgi:AraC family transcriptional regulator, positive regulator of tynA and feaB